MAGRHASLPSARAPHGRAMSVRKSMVPTTGESPEDVNTSSPQGLSVPATPGGARATLPADATGGNSPAEVDAGAPFAGKRSSRSRRRLRDYAVTDVPEVLPASAKRTREVIERIESSNTAAALGWTTIPKLPHSKDERFMINDQFVEATKRTLSRLKHFNIYDIDGVADTGVRSDSAPLCACGGRVVVALADSIKLWQVDVPAGLPVKLTKSVAAAEEAKRRGWRELPVEVFEVSPAPATNGSDAPGSGAEGFPEGAFTEFLPEYSSSAPGELVAAVERGFTDPRGVKCAPLRLWTVEQRGAAWGDLAGGVRNTKGNRFRALLAVYWALTHAADLPEGTTVRSNMQALERAGGKMLSATGVARFDAVSALATERMMQGVTFTSGEQID